MEYNWARGHPSDGDKYVDILHDVGFIGVCPATEPVGDGHGRDHDDEYHNSRDSGYVRNAPA